jgi:threonine dehydrogenase-like Zn-dependent dehydrogenase
MTVGQRVIVIPTVGCGRCFACCQGEPRDCSAGQFVGFTRHGAFARFVVAPAANCLPIPDAIDDELAALTEPLAVGAEAALVSEATIADTVVVLGAGTIAQAAGLMARRAGARVIVVGRDDASRFTTLRALGFDALIDILHEPLPRALRAHTGGESPDVVIEATGNPASVGEGLTLLKRGGVMVVAGIHAAAVEVNLTAFVRARQQLRATYRSATSTWHRTIACLAANPEAFRPMITHRLPLKAALEGFELARQRQASKVILFP